MEKSSTNTPTDLLNKIKEMLQHQRYAVRRASSMGMSRDEAAEMESRINQLGELVDQLYDRSRKKANEKRTLVKSPVTTAMLLRIDPLVKRVLRGIVRPTSET